MTNSDLARMIEGIHYRIDERGCWRWIKNKTRVNGYARFNGKMAHRLAWEGVNGPLPRGTEPDHLCRVRDCVNLEHLEAVTHRENVLRGNGVAAKAARQTICSKGHPLSGDNLHVPKLASGNRRRICLLCRRARTAAYKKRHPKSAR